MSNRATSASLKGMRKKAAAIQKRLGKSPRQNASIERNMPKKKMGK